MRLAILTVLPLLVVAACSEPAEPTQPTPAPAPAPVLGGVDLGEPVRALGTEPFWAVEITPTILSYSGLDRPQQTAANPGPVVQGTTAVFTAMTDAGNALVVTLISTECSDGMSDRVYPLTARVEIGQETLAGCAASSAAIMSTGEQGVVVEPVA